MPHGNSQVDYDEYSQYDQVDEPVLVLVAVLGMKYVQLESPQA